jgi:nitroreductase
VTTAEAVDTDDTVGFDWTDATAAVALAAHAPSIHNTQPWTWDLRDGVLSLRADRTRQLAAADPDGHSLTISCGAALALARIGLRLRGWTVSVRPVPDSGDPDLFAELRPLRRTEPIERDRARAAAATARRSERRPFGPGAVTSEEIEELRRAAASEKAFVHFPAHADDALDLAVAVSHTDRLLLGDEAYRDEVSRWLRADRNAEDGVPLVAVPHVATAAGRRTDVPLRDFELGVNGAQQIEAGLDERPLFAIVFTDFDRASHQLAAGESMMRLMIEAEQLGLASCALSQAVDMLAFRAHLKTFMSWTSYPQMVVRLGPRPVGTPAPMTHRRPVAEMLHQR